MVIIFAILDAASKALFKQEDNKKKKQEQEEKEEKEKQGYYEERDRDRKRGERKTCRETKGDCTTRFHRPCAPEDKMPLEDA